MTELRRVRTVGGGPAGLYAALLIKKAFPAADVVVRERTRPEREAGLGIVFSAKTLEGFRAACPRSYEVMSPAFVRWDRLEVRRNGATSLMRGHDFVAIERYSLLAKLAEAAEASGVRIEYGTVGEDDPEADLVLVSDGARSPQRERSAEVFGPDVRTSTHRYFWVASDYVFSEFAFLFEDAPEGILQAQAYPCSTTRSTLSFVVTEDTLRRAGLLDAPVEVSIAYLEKYFARHLHGGRLIAQESTAWGRFRTVRCRRWNDGRRCIVGDAAHTAHFTIGSGTKMAMEDGIALRDALVAGADVASSLDAYERARRPAVERIQAAAEANLDFVEHLERFRRLSQASFAFRFVTRSDLVTYEEARKRDNDFLRAVELSFTGDSALRPEQRPLALGQHSLRSRALHSSATMAGRASVALSAAERRLVLTDESGKVSSFELLRIEGVDSLDSDLGSIAGGVLWLSAEAGRAREKVGALLSRGKPVAILVDSTSSLASGSSVAEALRVIDASIPIGLVTGTANVDGLRTLLLGGRVDFVVASEWRQ